MRRYRGWVWAIGGLVATTAVIAGAARTAQLIAFRQWGPTGDLPLELLEPVLPFALVMAALAVSATATVVVLLRAGATVPAVGAALGTGIGPLSLLAFPVWLTPLTTNVGPTALSLAGGMVGAVLIMSVAIVVAKHLDEGSRDRSAPSWLVTAAYGLLTWACALVLVASPMWARGTLRRPQEQPDASMMAGWALLISGMIVAGWVSREAPVAAALRSAALAATPLALVAVMNRPGGAPAAPGWEMGDSDLPTAMTLTLAALVVTGALIGWALSTASWRTSAQATAGPEGTQPRLG